MFRFYLLKCGVTSNSNIPKKKKSETVPCIAKLCTFEQLEMSGEKHKPEMQSVFCDTFLR